jgi:tRNA(Ile)-lysidine synthase
MHRAQKPHVTADDPFVAKIDVDCAQLAPEWSQADQTVLVALSGGPDSCALLAAVMQLGRRGRNLQIHACHINHGLRGKEADADELFCAELCSAWGIPFAVQRVSFTQANEAALREARYALLAREAQRIDAGWILTGHTLDDQVETLLFRLFRGSSTKGLVGIPGRRKLTETITVMRPMLQLRRKEVLDFIARLRITPREDSSNRNDGYLRNYIRLQIIPKIADRFPHFVEAIERFRKSFSDDESLLEELCNKAVEQAVCDEDCWSLKVINDQPPAIRRRLVAQGLRQRQIEITQQRLHELLALAQIGSGRITLSKQWDAEMKEGTFLFVDKEALGAQAIMNPFQVELSVPGLTAVAELGVCIFIEAAQRDERSFPCASADEAVVELKNIVPPLVVRNRRPGDSIRPLGMSQHVSLKKYLHTHKTCSPRNPLRRLVLADANEVIWIPGVGISDIVKVQGFATHRLRLLSLDEEG